jgi:hypothetical protein
MYIANQFGTGIKHAGSVAEAFKSGVAVFEAGEKAYEVAVASSKTNFEAGTVALQSTIAEHIGKHLQNLVKAVCVIGATGFAAILILGGMFRPCKLTGPHGWSLSWHRPAATTTNSGKIFLLFTAFSTKKNLFISYTCDMTATGPPHLVLTQEVIRGETATDRQIEAPRSTLD